MQPLARVAKNSYVTVAPQQSPPACGSSQFRWWFHIALPFTLPSRRCVQQTVELEGTSYNFSIHNHLDRFVQFPDAQPTWPSVHLISRSDQLPQAKPGWRHVRETLQSVACFEEVTDYIQPDLAYADAGEKVRVAFAFLSEHLAMLQRQMPYLTSWQLYPISQFEVGLVYHGLRHFCPRTNRWEYLATGVTINLARQLHQPLCLVEFQGTPVTTSAADLSNELLAEAQVALLPRRERYSLINMRQQRHRERRVGGSN